MGETIVGTETMGFCATTANIWQVVGYVLLVFKIVIPILLIIFGMLDLGKAVMAGKEDEIKKNQTLFFKRVIAAVMVFLIIAVVKLVFGVLADASGDNTAVDCISKIIG